VPQLGSAPGYGATAPCNRSQPDGPRVCLSLGGHDSAHTRGSRSMSAGRRFGTGQPCTPEGHNRGTGTPTPIGGRPRGFGRRSADMQPGHPSPDEGLGPGKTPGARNGRHESCLACLTTSVRRGIVPLWLIAEFQHALGSDGIAAEHVVLEGSTRRRPSDAGRPFAPPHRSLPSRCPSTP
jgi:hypothetical protein